MRVQFELVRHDFLEAYRMQRMAQRIVKLLVALFVAGLVASAYLLFTHRVLAGGLLISALLVLFAVLFAKPHLDADREMTTSPLAGAPVTIVFSESGAVQTVAAMEHEWHWSSVRHFLETPNLLLFHHHDGSRTILPKRAFTAEQLAHLHLLAKRRTVGHG